MLRLSLSSHARRDRASVTFHCLSWFVLTGRVLSELGDLVETAGRVSKAAFVRTVRRELSCALCKGNARMYYNSLSRIAVHIGHNFRPGCDEPVEGPDGV